MIVKTKDYEVEYNSRGDEIIKIALNIYDIENMFFSEEKNYVDRLSLIFNEKWQSISLGDEVISETIKFHQDDTKKQMSKEFFQGINMQLRKVNKSLCTLSRANNYFLIQRAAFAVYFLIGRHGQHSGPSPAQSSEEKPWLCTDTHTDCVI